METFYATAAGLSFGLLGLWWVVVQFKYDAWLTDPARRRMAYDISLYFLLPGIMSLASLLATRELYLWRIGFGAAAVLGIVETAMLLPALNSSKDRFGLISSVITLVIYALVLVVAFAPTLPSDLGLNLTALEAEGILLTLLLFLGVNLVWRWFFERTPAPPA